MRQMNKHEFQGTVILSAQQLYEIVQTATETGARKALEEMNSIRPGKQLPELVPAKEAAIYLGYKSKATLRQYHHNELKPVRRGRSLFYDRDELIKLKKKIFNK